MFQILVHDDDRKEAIRERLVEHLAEAGVLRVTDPAHGNHEEA